MKNPVSDNPEKAKKEFSRTTDIFLPAPRVERGGGWGETQALASMFRFEPDNSEKEGNIFLGFRIVRNKPKGKK